MGVRVKPTEIARCLETLPGELIDMACEYLEPQDVCSLRLTCRTLNEGSLCRFIGVFKGFKVNLTWRSLQRLREAAGQIGMANAVRSLEVVYLEDFGIPSDSFDARGPKYLTEQQLAYHEHRQRDIHYLFEAEPDLIRSSVHSDLLLSRFKHCTTMRIYSPDPMDPVRKVDLGMRGDLFSPIGEGTAEVEALFPSEWHQVSQISRYVGEMLEGRSGSPTMKPQLWRKSASKASAGSEASNWRGFSGCSPGHYVICRSP